MEYVHLIEHTNMLKKKSLRLNKSRNYERTRFSCPDFENGQLWNDCKSRGKITNDVFLWLKTAYNPTTDT